jgi:predicted deacetylase
VPVHVSIHDVSPVWSAEVEDALGLCAEVGACPALLVVPNHHGHAPLLANERFCRRLRDLQDLGHEIYLHGLLHQAATRPDTSTLRLRVRWGLDQRVLSAGEAELAALAKPEGHVVVVEGERILREAGLRVQGYVAPAWAMPGWLLPVLAERGFRYTEDHLRVYDPAAGRSRASMVLNWASRSPARVLSTIAWCRGVRWTRAFVPTRIAIHPADMRLALLRREIRDALSWARGDFVSTGAALLP